MLEFYEEKKSQDTMNMYLSSLTKPKLIKKDFLEEAIY